MSWCLTSASSTGTSHIASGVECQDFSSYSVMKSIQGEAESLLLVVSDGAGSASQSSRGSELVCRSVVECCEYWASKSVATDLSGLLLHSAGHARQVIQKTANAESRSISDFAATCLCLLITDNLIAALQVGDGLIIVENASGSLGPVFWPRRYEYANTTTFLTSENWFKDLQYSQWACLPHSFFLCSDGIQSISAYSSSMSVVPSFIDAFKKVLSGESAGYSVKASRKIMQFLDSDRVNSRTDDDKTVLVGTKYQ